MDSVFVDSFTITGGEPEPGAEDILLRLDGLQEERARLLQKLEEIASEEKRLAKELEGLEEFRPLPRVNFDESSRLVTNTSSEDEKAELMFWTFRGSSTAYATRYWSKKRERYEYGPRCGLFGRNCPNSHQCGGCHSRKDVPLTTWEIIRRQLRNASPDAQDAVGVYAVDRGEWCHFLAFDFDKATWRLDSRALVRTARNCGFAAMPEISRSGNGCHVWIFFSGDVRASRARALAAALIDKTCSDERGLPFDSYDRVFPTQDSVARGQYGNLILMPLVAACAAKGRTVFVDDDWNPYPDQFRVLSQVPRHTAMEVEAFLANEEGGWRLKPDDLNPLWVRRLPELTAADFPFSPLDVHLSSGVTFDKRQLSKKAVHYFKRMASFADPAFYKQVRAYGWARKDLHSTRCVFVETERALFIPRGFRKHVLAILGRLGVEVNVVDHRVGEGRLGMKLRPGRELKPLQKEALGKALASGGGIIVAGTGFGKTVLGLALACTLDASTLVLVDKNNLVRQWAEKACDFLVAEDGSEVDAMLGTNFHAKKKGFKNILDIMTIQTAWSLVTEGRAAEIDRHQLVIVDECHHLAAETYEGVLKNLSPKYAFGLSATPDRADGLGKIVRAQLGNPIFEYGIARQALDAGLRQTYIIRFTMVRSESENAVEIKKELAANDERNRMIAEDTLALAMEGRRTIVFCSLVDHCDRLGKMLEEEGLRPRLLHGKLPKAERDEVLSNINGEMAADSKTVLVATDSIAGEGLDIPCLDAAVLASPMGSETKVVQAIGRIGREYEGKLDTRIVDYADIEIPLCDGLYKKRLRHFSKAGYVAGLSPQEAPEDIRSAYSSEVWPRLFLESAAKARSSVFVANSFASPCDTTRELSSLACKNGNSVDFQVFLSSKETANKYYVKALELMEDAGIKVGRFSSGKYHLVIIDSEEVWYGDVDVLVKPKPDAEPSTVIRFRDPAAAKSLMETIAGGFLPDL